MIFCEFGIQAIISYVTRGVAKLVRSGAAHHIRWCVQKYSIQILRYYKILTLKIDASQFIQYERAKLAPTT